MTTVLTPEQVRTHLARILFFVPGLSGSNGILHSQVLTPASVLAHTGFNCFFVGAESDGTRARQAQQEIERQYGFQCRIYPCRRLPIPYFGLSNQAAAVVRLAQNLIREWKPDFVYCREFYCVPAVNFAIRGMGASSVLDVRGAVSEETALKRGRGLRSRFLLQRERTAIRDAGRICCVSQNMKQWIQRQTGRQSVEVIPCCVNAEVFAFRPEARLSLRQKWGILDDELLFCYSGGLAPWQRIQDVIALFAQISHRIPKSGFLFLTRQQECLKAMLAASGLSPEKCIVTGCDHHKVAAHLSAADIGVVMRHDILVNNVASPVKVGEYMACGLPVMLTAGIGDYSQAVSREGLGLLLEEDGWDIERIQAFLGKVDLHELRQKIAGYAAKNLSWSSHIATFQRLYSRQVIT